MDLIRGEEVEREAARRRGWVEKVWCMAGVMPCVISLLCLVGKKDPMEWTNGEVVSSCML